jgi:hypothetical protein
VRFYETDRQPSGDRRLQIACVHKPGDGAMKSTEIPAEIVQRFSIHESA